MSEHLKIENGEFSNISHVDQILIPNMFHSQVINLKKYVVCT